ncbi:MAG: hypothetical protein IH840_04730 [Candidatus Heimdallarchaeota archaeon]|nr:hypothetical protein [Candidatus Heimdallarchaeota archaeon]
MLFEIFVILGDLVLIGVIFWLNKKSNENMSEMDRSLKAELSKLTRIRAEREERELVVESYVDILKSAEQLRTFKPIKSEHKDHFADRLSEFQDEWLDLYAKGLIFQLRILPKFDLSTEQERSVTDFVEAIKMTNVFDVNIVTLDENTDFGKKYLESLNSLSHMWDILGDIVLNAPVK